jgi:integrase
VAARHEVLQGTHTPESKSITVAEAAEDWITFVKLENRERSTVEHYRNHVDNHINKRIGQEKLAKLTTPRIQAFRDELLRDLSRAQAKKVLTSPQDVAARCEAARQRRSERCGPPHGRWQRTS